MKSKDWKQRQKKKITEQVTGLNYPGNKTPDYKNDMEYKLQTHNRISGIIKKKFW
jgi:hypothetical protein